MRGKVLGHEEDGGLILGDDDLRYRFTAAEWRGPQPPSIWTPVDFVPAGDMATSVYPLPEAVPAHAARPPVSNDDLLQNARTLSTVALVSGVLGLLPGLGLPFSVIGLVLGMIAAARARDDADEASLLRARIGYVAGGGVLALYLLVVVIGFAVLGGLAFLFGAGWG